MDVSNRKDFLDAFQAIGNNFRIIAEVVSQKPVKTFDRDIASEEKKETEDSFEKGVLECLSYMAHSLAKITEVVKENQDKIQRVI